MPSDRSTASVETPTQPLLLRERQDNVEVLTLNRAAARNSLSAAMIEDIRAALDAIKKDPGIRAVVLSANGPAFCAGHDLKELTAHRDDDDGGRAFYKKIMTSCSDMMQTIVTLPQPVIAVVQGIATAAGCQLVASCDLAVASTTAKFATPGVDIGLFCSTPMVALSRNVSRKHAMEMLLTGDMISAEHAFNIGLLNRIVTPGRELEEGLALASKIAAKSSHAVKIGKEAFYRQAELGLAEAYEYTAAIMVDNLLGKDAKEGICAFIEKRPPHWPK